MGRTFLDIDMARAADLLGMERRQAEMFRDLERGHFVGLGPALSRRPLAIRIGAAETATRSAGPKLVPPPDQASAEEARELILAAPDPAPALPPRRAARAPAPDILAQLAAARPAPPPEPAAPESAEEKAARRARVAEVLRGILADPEAPFRPPGVLYQDFLVRCRIQEIPGPPPDLPAFRRLLATARAGIGAEAAEGSDWQQAVTRAESLPEDSQGVYLLLARAALEKLPCPSDATIARAYGTRSPGRARRLLAWLEERNALVLRMERGRRVVALVGLGWETAPGDPDAAAA
jgi:hypothetical protein